MRHLLLFPLLLVLALGAGAGELRFASVFGPSMVLQADQPLPVWGRAVPGASVRVAFRGQRVSAVANAEGRWFLRLAPEAASFEAAELLAESGDEAVRLADVLVGEVWLCSGQSNMEWSVRKSLDADLEIPAARHPGLRLLRMDRVVADKPRADSAAVWRVCSPDTVADFSAVGYQFGRMLSRVLDVPVGLIDASWSGTPAIAWTRESAMAGHPLFRPKLVQWEMGMPRFAQGLERWREDIAAWKLAHGHPAGQPVNPWRHPDAPAFPSFDPQSPHRPASLANGMLAPLAPYALRGVIWYQGESDVSWEPERYGERLQVMFADWRAWWENPSLHVGIVQLANFQAAGDEPFDGPWPRLRESQRHFARSFPHAGLAVTIDAGEAHDIHPADKQVVGRRLARWALADVYGRIALRGGPELAQADFVAGRVKLRFSQTGNGLHALNGPLAGFTLAGADGVFHPADALIQAPDTVWVESSAVPEPVAVRYAWHNNPSRANLHNRERLPASPFEARALRP